MRATCDTVKFAALGHPQRNLRSRDGDVRQDVFDDIVDMAHMLILDTIGARLCVRV
jgi:hypothetical protein